MLISSPFSLLADVFLPEAAVSLLKFIESCKNGCCLRSEKASCLLMRQEDNALWSRTYGKRKLEVTEFTTLYDLRNHFILSSRCLREHRKELRKNVLK